MFTRDGDRVFLFGTFLGALKLFRMTIQQDSYQPDRWWFAPLLYAGAAVLIAALPVEPRRVSLFLGSCRRKRRLSRF